MVAVTPPVDSGTPNEVSIWRYGAPATLERARTVPGAFDISKIEMAPDDSVVFAGHLRGEATFDSCTIAPYANSEVDWSAYVTRFQPDLTTRFCKRLTNDVTGIAADTTRIAVAYATVTQLHYVDMVVYDTAGNVIASRAEDAYVGAFGRPGPIWLGTNGRFYLQVFASFMAPNEVRWPFLVTIQP